MTESLTFVTVSPADGTLYHLAAKYYGDPTQWLVIAKANGFSGPHIDSVMTLYIPASNPRATGGVSDQ